MRMEILIKLLLQSSLYWYKNWQGNILLKISITVMKLASNGRWYLIEAFLHSRPQVQRKRRLG